MVQELVLLICLECRLETFNFSGIDREHASVCVHACVYKCVLANKIKWKTKVRGRWYFCIFVGRRFLFPMKRQRVEKLRRKQKHHGKQTFRSFTHFAGAVGISVGAVDRLLTKISINQYLLLMESSKFLARTEPTTNITAATVENTLVAFGHVLKRRRKQQQGALFFHTL